MNSIFIIIILLIHPVIKDKTKTIYINPTVQYQKFQGWGTSLAWFAHILGGAPDSIRNHYADLIFDKKYGLGLNIVRYNIGGGGNPKYHYLHPRAAVPGYEPEPGHYNWNADKNQRWFLKAAIKRGVDIAEAFSNSPPYWMTISSSVTGAKNGGNNLKKRYYQSFANYLVTVTNHFKNYWGIQFYSLEPFNEPVSWWWKFGGRQEGCHFSNKAQNTVLKMVGRDLMKSRSATELTVPDDNTINQTITSFKSYDAEARHYIKKINTHAYGGNKRTELYKLAKKSGKKLWVSEYGDGDASGLKMSSDIVKDLGKMHASAWIYWQIVDGGGWGMLSTNLNAPKPYHFHINEKYYVMENYSRFIRPGDKVIKVTERHSIAVYNSRKSEVTVVTTNVKKYPERITYQVNNVKSYNTRVKAYQTTGISALKLVFNKRVSSNKVVMTLPARSVTTVIFEKMTLTQ